MNNICRNGIQALVVYKDSYLCHKQFSSFKFDGSSTFTIEIRFAYTKTHSGILYSQDDGMTIGFNNDIPYFDHPLFGRMEGTDDRKLKSNSLLMLSVTYDLSKAVMQINGIAVNEIEKNPKGSYTASGDYAIGKGFDGFIEGVRILKKVPDSQKLISDYGIGFSDDPDVVFQTDFSTVQFKDIGPEKVDMWRTGTDAHCANVVTTTRLDQKSAYKRTNKLTFKDGFSMSARLFPDFSCKTKQTIYSMVNKDTKIAVSMEPDAENNNYLSACIGSTYIKSTKAVDGLLWHDIVLAVDIKNKKASLYLDGEVVAYGEPDIPEITDAAPAVIGSEYFDDKPYYKEGCLGYIDYIAEFSKMVSQEEVVRFIEHEPYFYDDGIESLLLFGWGEPRNALLGCNIAEFGSGYYTMVEDTCPLDAPRGTGWIVPQEPDEEYWNGLTDNERWALETYVEVANATISEMIGIPMKDPSVEPVYEIVHRKYLGPDTQEVLEWARGFDNTEIDAIIEEESVLRKRVSNVFKKAYPEGWKAIQQPLTTIEPAASTVVAPIAAGGVATTGMSAGDIVVGVATAAALVGVVVYIIKKLTEDRPDNPNAKIQVLSCSWNNQGKADSGTIYFHNDLAGIGPSSMEWENTGIDVKIQAVFVPSVLKELILRVKVINTGDAEFVGDIKIKSGDQSWSSDIFTLGMGQSTVVNVNQSDLIAKMDKELSTKSGYFTMSYKNPETGSYYFMNNLNYKYISLENKPINPWQLDEGKDYDPNNGYYIRTAILDSLFSVNNSNIEAPAPTPAEQGMANWVINWMNNSGLFAYDTVNGDPFYVEGFNEFKVDKFTRDIYDGTFGHDLNCVDCANIMHAICAINGIDLPMIRLYGVDRDDYECNQIRVISNVASPWAVPFDGTFSFHMVNRTANGVNDGIGIYDACLKVDGGDYPGIDEAPGGPAKVPLQPSALQAQATDYANINVPTTAPYQDLIYRERLVRDGEWAAFVNTPGSVQTFRPGDYTAELSGLQITEGKLKSDKRISDLKLLSWEFKEYEWRFSFDGSIIEIMLYEWACSEEDMNSIIAQCTNPKRTEIKDDTAGIEGIRVGESSHYIRKNDKIYRIIGEKAMTVAKEVL